MWNNIYRNFILNNSLGAVSAITDENSTFATDGFECKIHEFDSENNYIDCHRTIRPYRRLRSNDNGCGNTALGCCNSARVYFLSENFRETGYVQLDISCEWGCGCSCGCDDLSEITDAMLVNSGNETYIIGAFRKSAYLFDINGNRLTKLCSADGNEILTDFVTLGSNSFAMGTLCGNSQTVTVSEGDNIQSAVLARGHTLRMLIPSGNELYGLFGREYIYNRIIKIYSNGILQLP